MGSDSLKLLLRAESIIQRDALLAALHAEGLHAISPSSDLSRKVTDSTVDLAYGGYSAMFEGFAIQVPENEFEQADAVVKQVLARAQKFEVPDSEVTNRNIVKFYFCCLFSTAAPILMHALALYHLRNAIRLGEKVSWIGVGLGLLWLVATVFTGLYMFKLYFARLFII